MADTASRDPNYVPSLLAVSNVDGVSTVVLYADPVTHRLLVNDTAGGVEGPGLSTSNAIALWNGTTGDTLKNSLATVDGSGNITATNISGTNTGDQTTSGTSNRISVTSGTTNPVVDISASYVGQASITTLGTIATGTWNGTTIAVANGGTGSTTLVGAGIPKVVASADLTAQSAAVASITTTTVPNDGSNHTYSVGGYITVTAISVNTITLQLTYTDETSTSRTQSFFGEGLTTAAVSTTGGFAFPPMTIRAKANTAITVLTSVVGVGSETYDTGGYIMQIN